MRITLMHNPKAGKGRHGKEMLMAALKKAGHRATYQSTKKNDYQEALKEPTDLVLVAGGDGTVGKVGRELIDRAIPLAILPLGTANNIARTLGFTDSIEKIIQRLRYGKKRVFDVGVAKGPWGKKYFFESIGGGLLAEYVRKAHREDKKHEGLSKQQELTRHVSLLCGMLHKYRAHKWKIAIDGHNGSDRYVLWEAMNIESVGPALYLASRAATKDGFLDFVSVPEEERSLLQTYLDEWLAGRRKKFPFQISRCRKIKIKIPSSNSTLRLDGKLWPDKKQKSKKPYEIEITVKPSALVILQPSVSRKSHE
jgi:diacylglycerol kinase family enzyme